MTKEMREGIISIWNKYNASNIKKLYLYTNIPPEKLQNALNKYGGGRLVEDEEAICLFDETLLGSGKAGFMLTTKNLCLGNNDQYGGSSIILPVEQVDALYYEKAFAGRISVQFGQNCFNLVIDGWRDTPLFGELLWELINYLKTFSGVPENNTSLIVNQDNSETPPSGPLCPHCNTPIEEGEKFCSGCGAKLPEAQTEAPQATASKKVCSNCKKDLEHDWTVCPYCQTKVITLTCKKCRRDLQEEWLVCPYCNTKTGPKLCAGCGKELHDEWKACPFCSAAVE